MFDSLFRLNLDRIDAQDFEGRTLLIRLAIKGDIELVKILIGYGADVYIKDFYGKTVMDYSERIPELNSFFKDIRTSIITSNISKIEEYLNSQPSIDINQFIKNKTLLQWSCEFSNLKVMEFLLAKGANPELGTLKEIKGVSVIEPVLFYVNNVKMLNLLVRYGADINGKDNNNDTVLMQYCYNNFKKGVDCLLSWAVKQNKLRALIDAKNGLGITPLIIAAMQNNIGIINVLISHGADINDSNDTGITPLMSAVRRSNYLASKYLIDLGAKVNVKDIFGKSILDYALLLSKIDYYAIDIVLIIIDKLTTTELQENSPFFIVENECLEIDEALLEKGLNPNIQDSQGYTPLMLGVMQNNEERISLYLSYGADPNLPNIDGLTAYDIASQYEDLKLYNLLPQLEFSQLETIEEPEELKKTLPLTDIVSMNDVEVGTEYVIAQGNNDKYYLLGEIKTFENIIKRGVRGTNNQKVFVPLLNYCVSVSKIKKCVRKL